MVQLSKPDGMRCFRHGMAAALENFLSMGPVMLASFSLKPLKSYVKVYITITLFPGFASTPTRSVSRVR